MSLFGSPQGINNLFEKAPRLRSSNHCYFRNSASRLDTLSRRFDECWWIQGQPHLAIEQVLQVIRLTNGLIDRHKPWEKNSVIESEHVIALAAESLRLTGLLLSPVVPNLAARLLRRLGCEQKGEEPLDDHLPQNKLFWSLGPDTGPLLLRLP